LLPIGLVSQFRSGRVSWTEEEDTLWWEWSRWICTCCGIYSWELCLIVR
jgi:hypothetical protein